MKLKPEELIANKYELLDELNHQELIPFIQKYMKKVTKFSIFYFSINFTLFGLTGYFFAKGLSIEDYSFGQLFTYFSYGLAIAIALLPIHEYIHVLAYKSQGAINTSYDSNWKKFYFMALADKFVANKKEFTIVALSPFLIITTVLVALLFFVNFNWTMTLIGALLAHSSMCSGDFALMSYFDFHKDKKIVTYDDVENKISYFYRRVD